MVAYMMNMIFELQFQEKEICVEEVTTLRKSHQIRMAKRDKGVGINFTELYHPNILLMPV